MGNKIFADNRYTILDGAMGTMLQNDLLIPGQAPDLLSLTHPTEIQKIHTMYIQSGADCILTNTFSSNSHKLKHTGYTPEQIIRASVKLAKQAAAQTNVKVILDVGPIGELLEPNGSLTFEQAYSIYCETVRAGEAAGADAVLFETMSDLYELKAAILAARETTSLPILASMSFEQNGRTFTGCSVEAMAATLSGLGVEAVGINCSLGPEEIFPIAQTLCSATPLPVFIKPNAGLPNPHTGEFPLTPDLFCQQMQPFEQLGVLAVGGCCGTTPEYIKLLAESFNRKTPASRSYHPKSIVCSSTKAVWIDRVTVIGERINPTGKKRFQQALLQQDTDYILSQAIEQMNAGAEILDVNVGMPDIDETETMVKTIKKLQAVCPLPLQLDSSNPDVLQAGLRIYNGKPIVNSVNAKDSSLEAILPLCKKYGAAVVGLTLNENGIPSSAEDRFCLAKKIVQAAQQLGIPRQDIFIDCLTLTASAQQQDVYQTLKAIEMVSQRLGVNTILGVSNISFGLPRRELLNACFLTLALAHGLTMPMINPNAPSMMDAIMSFRVLYHIDKNAIKYIEQYGGDCSIESASPAPENSITLRNAVLQGLSRQAENATQIMLKQSDPETIIQQTLIPALDEVGERFESGKFFLPQLLQAADAAQAAFRIINKTMAETSDKQLNETIVLATVTGDIHDIGKNIVKTLLSNYGFHVVDLGRDVPISTVVEAVQKHNAKLVGLSALMTTTLIGMEQTISAIHSAGLDCKIMVGGAVLTPEYAKKIGADYYAKDAKQSVDIAKKVFAV